MIAIMSCEIMRLLEPLSPQAASFAAGAAVFRLGDPVRLIHLVRAGTVCLLRHHRNGARLVLQRATAGAILAEASVFSDRYHCDAVAATPAATLCVPRHAVLDRIGADGAFARAWAMHLAREVQQARLRAEIMSARAVSARLDAWLTWHGALPPKGEWVGLAAEIGVSPEALYREIAKRRG